MIGKVCSRCSDTKPLDQFQVTDRKTGRRRTWCIACERARVTAHYASNEGYRERRKAAAKLQVKTPEASRKHMLKSNYGITHEQYDQLLLEQTGKCALCRAEKVGNGRWEPEHWHVDHDHGDGHVRGLLCQKCNTQLGSYESLLDRVGEIALLDYLTRPNPIAPPVVAEAVPLVFEQVLASYSPRPSRPLALCCVEDCGRMANHAGYCDMHYMRVWRGSGPGMAAPLPHASAKGEAYSSSKLTADDITFIRSSPLSGRDLARRFDVSATLITNIRTGKTWTHIGGDVREAQPKVVLQEADVRRIRDNGESPTALAREYGVTVGTIHDIRKRRSWKHVT